MQAKNSTKECNLPVLYRLQAELLATVQPGKIATEHNSQDIYHVICLTLRNLPPSHLLVDQPAQLAQTIGAEQGATSADRDYEIGLVDISPLDRQRAQPPLSVQIRDAVPAPVVAHSNNFEGLTPQRMKGMRDGEN